MISTDSTAYIERSGKLVPIAQKDGPRIRWFITAMSIDDIRELLRSEVCAEVPVLFITRQITGIHEVPPPIDYQI